MDKRFREYLEKHGVEPLDPKVLEDYNKTMIETVVPDIIENIKRREWYAMELRFPSSTTADSEKK